MNILLFLSIFLCKIILIYSDEVTLSCAETKSISDILWKYLVDTECTVKNFIAKNGDTVIYENATRTFKKNPYSYPRQFHLTAYQPRGYNPAIGWHSPYSSNTLTEITEAINFYNLVNGISFKNSSIPFIPESVFYQMPKIKSFDMSSTGIEVIQSSDFIGATNLVHLYLSDNKITELPSDMFSNMTNLLKIDLSKNHIDQISEDTFTNANQLARISLSYNRIKNLDENIFSELNELEVIALDHNLLTYIHENMFVNNLKLKLIELNHNEITEIDANAFGHLNHLQMIDLSSNSIAQFDTEYMTQYRLEFNISNNKLNELNLLNWDTFDASNNQLIDLHISENITYNNRKLFLSGNSIKDTKSIFKLFDNLEYLDLSDTMIGNITSTTLNNLSSLKVLRLCNCSLTNINNFGTFSGQKELIVLDISSNNLNKIDFLTFYPYLKKLSTLYIHGNNLTKLDGLSSDIFPMLTNIGISNNHFLCLDITNLLIEFKSNDLKIIKSAKTEIIDSHHVGGVACEYDEKMTTKKPTTSKPSKQIRKTSDEPHSHHFLITFIGIALILCFVGGTYKAISILKNKRNILSDRFGGNL